MARYPTRQKAINQLIGEEHGKISHDAGGELQRGIENVEIHNSQLKKVDGNGEVTPALLLHDFAEGAGLVLGLLQQQIKPEVLDATVQALANAVHFAREKGAKIVLITDSELCPHTQIADHVLIVREADVRGFRSLNSSLCLLQTLCVALGYQR